MKKGFWFAFLNKITITNRPSPPKSKNQSSELETNSDNEQNNTKLIRRIRILKTKILNPEIYF